MPPGASTINHGGSPTNRPSVAGSSSSDDDDGEPSFWLRDVVRRFPWLLGLMLVQSISSSVVEHFSGLVEKHVVLASFLTMLVGGGGNSSGQTVVETVKLLSRRGRLGNWQVWRLVLRELAIGATLAVLLGFCAYPRVSLLSAKATSVDAFTISISYALIVVMANLIGVIVAITLHSCDMAGVGAPPVVQVVVDVLGVTVTMLIAQAVMGDPGAAAAEEGDAPAT